MPEITQRSNVKCSTKFYDIIIVGAGMVGASLAASLRHSNYTIALIDKALPTAESLTKNTPHLRVSSINLGAVRWLKQQGIWQHIHEERIQNYNTLSAFESGGTAIEFKAHELNEDKLGCFIENTHLQYAALQTLGDNCDVYAGHIEQIKTLSGKEAAQSVILDDDTQLTCQLLIGADGSRSVVAEHGLFASQSWQYRQQCLSVNIKLDEHTSPQHLEKLQQGTWQTFRPEGPIAFLPLYDTFATLIVYDTAEKVKHYASLNKTQLKSTLLALFTQSLLPPTHSNVFNDVNNEGIHNHDAHFEIIESASFPLTRRTIHHPMKDHLLLIGDAAHNIHPLAGQGVNLGLRDVAAASHVLLSLDKQENWSQAASWQSYLSSRKKDVLATTTMMDLTYKLFSNDNALLKQLRKITLNGLNIISPIKKTALHFALGLNDKHV